MRPSIPNRTGPSANPVATATRHPHCSTHQTNLRQLLLVIAALLVPFLHAQRSSMETQTNGGFLLLDNLCALNSTDVLASGHVEQGFRYGAICRMDNNSAVWSKKLRNSAPYYANTFHDDITITGSNDILVAGQEVLYAPSCHVARLDQSGDLVWSTTLNVGSGQQQFGEVLEAPDGNIYAIGTIGDFEQADIVVAKFTSNGVPLWVRIADEPGEQYSRCAVLVNDTLHVLGSTAVNGGDVALLSFTPVGDLVRSLFIGTPSSERPLGMAHDGAGGLLISYGHEYYDMVLARVGPSLGPTLSTWSIDTPLQLDLQAGLHFDPVSGECILMGNRVSMAYALRISLANSTVVWERSFPDFYSFFGMTLTGDGATLVASGGPFGYLSSGSYPSEFVRLDPTTGNERSGPSCMPSTPSVITLSRAELPYCSVNLPVRTPIVEVFNGIEVSDLQLVTTHCIPIVLPIELTSWSAEPMSHAIKLSWSTASERNSDRFIIERSLDTDVWEPIGEVISAGNSSIPVDYIWNDLFPDDGTNYYRLRQIDLDGSQDLSTTVAVDWSDMDISPLFYPNPAAPGQLITAVGTVLVFDALGKELLGPVDRFMAPERPGVYLVQGQQRCQRLLVH